MLASLSHWHLMPDSGKVRTHGQKNHTLTISATLVSSVLKQGDETSPAHCETPGDSAQTARSSQDNDRAAYRQIAASPVPDQHCPHTVVARGRPVHGSHHLLETQESQCDHAD